MSDHPCDDCGARHGAGDVRAIGIFDPADPFGFMPIHENAGIYATRQDATDAMCAYRKEQTTSRGSEEQ